MPAPTDRTALTFRSSTKLTLSRGTAKRAPPSRWEMRLSRVVRPPSTDTRSPPTSTTVLCLGRGPDSFGDIGTVRQVWQAPTSKGTAIKLARDSRNMGAPREGDDANLGL